MRRALSILGFILAAVLFFILGLIPGERVILSPGADSYILIGIARFAVHLTGLCEFLLGAAVVALWCTVRSKLYKRTQNAANQFTL